MALSANEIVIVDRALHAIGAQPLPATYTNIKQGRWADTNYAKVRDEVLRRHPWNEAIVRTTLPGEATVDITAVNQGTRTFTLEGDYTLKIQVGDTVTVAGSTGNNGDYTVDSVAANGSDTDVIVEEAIPDATGDGTMTVRNTFKPDWGYDHAHTLPSDFIRLVYIRDPECPHAIEGDRILSDDSDLELLYVKRLSDPADWSANLEEAIVAKLAAELVLTLTGDDRKHAQQIEIYQLKLRDAKLADAHQGGPTSVTRSTWTDARRRFPRRERTRSPRE